MDLAEFNFTLPEDLIAQAPLADRAASRMLVVDRARQTWEDRQFRDLPAFLGAGDCLVLNDSRVFPARLFGHRAGRTGEVEVLLLRPGAGAARQEDACRGKSAVRGGPGGGSYRAPRFRPAHATLRAGGRCLRAVRK